MEITAHGSSGTGQLLKDISNKSRVDNIRRRQCWRRRAWLGRHSISLMCVLLCRAEGNKEGELCVKSRWAENGRLARKFRHHKVRAIYIVVSGRISVFYRRLYSYIERERNPCNARHYYITFPAAAAADDWPQPEGEKKKKKRFFCFFVSAREKI